MNHSRLQYRLPYGDDDLDDSICQENPDFDFEELNEEAEDKEDKIKRARGRTLRT